MPLLYRSFFLCLIAFTLIEGDASASENQYIGLNPKTSNIYIAPKAEYLEDKSHQLTLKQLLSQGRAFEFQKNSSPKLEFGYSNSAWWVHFSIINHSEKPSWRLLIDRMLGSELTLYAFPAGATGKGYSQKTVLYAQRIEDYHRPAWRLELPKNQTIDIYIRATNGQKKVSLPIQILSEDRFLTKTTQDYILYSSIYAALFAFAIYQFIMYSGLREKSYLLFGIHIIILSIALHPYNPVLNSLNFLGDTDSHWFQAPMLLAISTSIWVYKEIMDTRRYSYRVNQVFIFSILIVFALTPLIGFADIYSGKIIMWVGTMYITLIIIGGGVIYRRGNKIALYVVLLSCIFIILQIPNWWQTLFSSKEWNPQRNLSLAISNLLNILGIAWIQAIRVRFIYKKLHNEEAANKAKDHFLATMSHELRTPLHGITNLGTLLSLEKLTKKQKQYVDHLNAAAQHQLQLINNLLDFSKFSKQQANTDKQAFQLDIMLEPVITLEKRQAEEKNLEFIYQFENLPQSAVLGDRLKLSQILLNLLSNAVKYTDYGHIKLQITSKPIKNNKFQITFSIKDTGQGIAKEKLDTIFNPFVQISAEQSEGIGLGLALCKKFVQAMGGELEVRSELGKYSHFFFTLQLFAEEHTATQAENLPTNDLLPKGLRVLLTDDSEINRFIGKEMLINMGANVELAHNGEQAIITLQKSSFDIVLMDINMPDIDGFEVSRWVRKNAYNPQVPIIALTAHSLDKIRQTCTDAGMNYFISKPFDYNSLHDAITQQLPKQANPTPMPTDKSNNAL